MSDTDFTIVVYGKRHKRGAHKLHGVYRFNAADQLDALTGTVARIPKTERVHLTRAIVYETYSGMVFNVKTRLNTQFSTPQVTSEPFVLPVEAENR